MNHIFSKTMWVPPELPLEEILPAGKISTFERRQCWSGLQGTSNSCNVRFQNYKKTWANSKMTQHHNSSHRWQHQNHFWCLPKGIVTLQGIRRTIKHSTNTGRGCQSLAPTNPHWPIRKAFIENSIVRLQHHDSIEPSLREKFAAMVIHKVAAVLHHVLHLVAELLQ